MTTPRKFSPKKLPKAVASRVARTANTVNQRATKVHNHAWPFSCLVAVSSMFNCSGRRPVRPPKPHRMAAGRRHLVLDFHGQCRGARLIVVLAANRMRVVLAAGASRPNVCHRQCRGLTRRGPDAGPGVSGD